MPKIGDKKFPYTQEGKADAKKEKAKQKKKKKYSNATHSFVSK